MSERNIDERVAVLEQIARQNAVALQSIDERLRRVDETVIRIDERLNTALPHLATKAELTVLDSKLSTELAALRIEIAQKPGRGHIWAVMGVLLAGQAVILAVAGLVIALLLPRLVPSAPTHAAGIVLAADRPFDWDRYHARQDACAEKDRITAACAKGVEYCDALALRQATRACSAFGPLGGRSR